jgi:hypothetical protein
MRAAIVLVLFALGCEGRKAQPAPEASTKPESSSASAPAPTASAPRSIEFKSLAFDADTPGSAPPGFTSARTGGGRAGAWAVLAQPDAPSAPNVLAQTDTDPTDSRFALFTLDEPDVADVSVSVKCKPVSGKIDQACGVVCRMKDANNYYLARANALENNVRFYVVQNGKRTELGSMSTKVASGEWHRLGMICHGSHFTVTFDQGDHISKMDSTFPGAGKVGLWTKADSVTYFDDLFWKRVYTL